MFYTLNIFGKKNSKEQIIQCALEDLKKDINRTDSVVVQLADALGFEIYHAGSWNNPIIRKKQSK